MLFLFLIIDVECVLTVIFDVFFFKRKTAYEMRISDWSSDVCSSDLSQPISEQGQVRPLFSAEIIVHHPAARRIEPLAEVRPLLLEASLQGAAAHAKQHRDAGDARLADRKSTRLNSSH